MAAKTLKEFYTEHRAGHNPITGEPNLYKDISDEMIWNAATKAAEQKFKSPNKATPPCTCKRLFRGKLELNRECPIHGVAI